ncbi:MAG: hypothetical protein ACRBBS_14985 [Thalassovita sp.]
MTILTNAPIWVWPVFLLLLMLGLRATRDRKAPLALILALPLLGVLSIRTLAGLPAPVWGWAVWGGALILGGVLGAKLQSRWLIEREGWTVTLRGEWLTLTTMMFIFWSNFATGMLQAVAPQILTAPGFVAGLACTLGLCSGSFLGRAIRTLRT